MRHGRFGTIFGFNRVAGQTIYVILHANQRHVGGIPIPNGGNMMRLKMCAVLE